MVWWFGFFFVKIWKNIIKATVNYTLFPVSPYLFILNIQLIIFTEYQAMPEIIRIKTAIKDCSYSHHNKFPKYKNMNRYKTVSAAFKAFALLTFAFSAQATNLITNGNFTDLTNGAGQLGYNTNATGWTAEGTGYVGYTFVFLPGTADTTGSPGEYNILSLWGPGNGSSNGFNSNSIPGGGNLVAIDGDFQNAAIAQTVTGLTAGDQYTLTFDYAFAQQYTFSGATSQYTNVIIGGTTYQVLSPTTYVLDNHGLSGWFNDSITFTASAASEVIEFAGNSSPAVPPFPLLVNVSLTAALEPEILALFGIGLLGFFAVDRKIALPRNCRM
jgi:hypothetical protein